MLGVAWGQDTSNKLFTLLLPQTVVPNISGPVLGTNSGTSEPARSVLGQSDLPDSGSAAKCCQPAARCERSTTR